MSQFGFHITPKENVADIQSEGLHASTDGQWRRDRKTLRQKIDTYANENFDSWVNRENAVFFWSKISDAERFADAAFDHATEYAIITVDLSNYTVWTTDNQLIEQLFETWMEGKGIRNPDQKFTELQSNSSEWTGEARTSYELWCQGPIHPEDITDIR